MKDIILVGGGGHCRAVIDVIEQNGEFKIAGIVDIKENIGKKVLGYQIIGQDSDLENLFLDYKYALVTIGQIENPNPRIAVFNMLQNIGFNIPVIKSPIAYVSKHAFVDKGSVIMHGVIVNSNAKIGKNCIINSNALIEHDVIVGNNCHISTGAILNGGAQVEDNSFFGSNSTSKQYSKVGGFIKAGRVAL